MALIKDAVFNHRGPVPAEFWSALSIRAGGTHIDDALKKRGGNGSDPVAVPVVSVEPRSKKILGSRWEIRGHISQRCVKASTIWTGMSQDISVTWDFSGSNQLNYRCRFHGYILYRERLHILCQTRHIAFKFF